MVVKIIIGEEKVLTELKEKAVSKKQQRFFGMVRAAQKGEGAASPEVAKVAGEISKKDAKDFAKTKHKGLPEKKKVKEEVINEIDFGSSMKKGSDKTFGFGSSMKKGSDKTFTFGSSMKKKSKGKGKVLNISKTSKKKSDLEPEEKSNKQSLLKRLIDREKRIMLRGGKSEAQVKKLKDERREKVTKAMKEDYVIEKEDSPYEHASRGSLAGKTRSTGTSEKEHKTSFRRKAHRNSAAMIIRAKRNAERSGKKLSDDDAGDLAHKGWASSVKHHKSSMTPEQQKRRQKLADTPYKKLSKDEQDKDKVSAKAIMSVHDKQKKKTVKEASAALDANTKLEKAEKRKKDEKEYAKLIAIYNHQKQLEKQGLGSPTKRKKTSESFEIDKSAHKKVQRQAKIRNLAKGNKNPNEKSAAESKLKGPKLAWEDFKKHI